MEGGQRTTSEFQPGWRPVQTGAHIWARCVHAAMWRLVEVANADEFGAKVSRLLTAGAMTA